MRLVKAFSVLLGIILLTVSGFGQQSKRDEGIDLYRAGNFAEALSRLTEATAEDRTDYQAWLYLAAAYKHLGKEKEATKAFDRALTIKRQILRNTTSRQRSRRNALPESKGTTPARPLITPLPSNRALTAPSALSSLI